MIRNYLQTNLKILIRYPQDFTEPLYHTELNPTESDTHYSNYSSHELYKKLKDVLQD